MSTDAAIIERITEMAAAVQKDTAAIGVFSTGEKIAVALVLNRIDLLEGYTILEAVNRLGPAWTQAALSVQRSRGGAFLVTPSSPR